jgi:hypothetical protein
MHTRAKTIYVITARNIGNFLPFFRSFYFISLMRLPVSYVPLKPSGVIPHLMRNLE